MITEFTCGIYKAKYNAHAWHVSINQYIIARIPEEGKYINFTHDSPHLTESDLLEILVLMNNIKRQYKQLQIT